MDVNILNEMNKIASLTKEEAIENFGLENIKEGFFTCKTCGKQTPYNQLKLIEDINGPVTDFICDECRKTFDKMKVCIIACLGCKDVIARMEPKKDKTGFETKPGKVYHIIDCPKCNPEKYSEKDKATPSTLIEAQIYNQKFSKKSC